VIMNDPTMASMHPAMTGIDIMVTMLSIEDDAMTMTKQGDTTMTVETSTLAGWMITTSQGEIIVRIALRKSRQADTITIVPHTSRQADTIMIVPHTSRQVDTVMIVRHTSHLANIAMDNNGYVWITQSQRCREEIRL